MALPSGQGATAPEAATSWFQNTEDSIQDHETRIDVVEADKAATTYVDDEIAALSRAALAATGFRVTVGSATEDFRATGISIPCVTMTTADPQRMTGRMIRGKDFPAFLDGQTVDVKLRWVHAQVTPSGNVDFVLRTKFASNNDPVSGTPSVHPTVSVDTTIRAANTIAETTLLSGLTMTAGKDLIVAVDRLGNTDSAAFDAYLLEVVLDLA